MSDDRPFRLVAGQRYVEAEPIDSVEPHPDNVNEGDVGAIVESLDEHGFFGAIMVQESTRRIIYGEHRWRAAMARNADTLPMFFVDVDDDEARRMALVDNETTRKGHNRPDDLAALLVEMERSERGLAGTGFDGDDLGALLEDLERAGATIPVREHERGAPDPDDDRPPTIPTNPVTQRGDVWLIGPHRVMCGDCRDAADVARLLDGATINLAVTSPPYADRREYDEASGFRPIPPDDYVEWFAPVAEHVAAHLAEDGSWFVNIKPGAETLDTELYVFDLVIAHRRRWGWHFATEFCWERGGMPKEPVLRLKNQFEPVYQFTRGRWKFRPGAVMHPTDSAITPSGPGSGNTSWASPSSNFTTQGEVGGKWFEGRVVAGMAYPGNRLPTFSGSHEATGHTAAFPVGLPEFFVKAYTDEGDAVYDPFVGSGSTVLAAARQARRGFGMEVSAGYVDLALARLQRHLGAVPVLERTGDPVDFLALV